MPGEKSTLTPLQSRKQLLVLESELNRALLQNEVKELKGEFRQLTQQVRSIGSIVSTAADLAGTVADLGHAFSPRNSNEKKRPSWISTLIEGAKAGASLWGSWQARKK